VTSITGLRDRDARDALVSAFEAAPPDGRAERTSRFA